MSHLREITPNNPIVPLEPPSTYKIILSALAIIAGLGGLAAFGIGFAVNSIVAIVVGSIAGFPLLIIGIIVGLRYVAEMASYNQELAHQRDQRDIQQREEFVAECNGRLCNYPQHQIKGDHYFDAAKWRTHYGLEVVGDPQIPQDLRTYLETPCPFAQQEGLKVKDTHMVLYIPPNQTLRSFSELPRTRNPAITDHIWGESSGDGVNITPLLEGFDTPLIQRPYWLLMTRHTIPGSKSLSFESQQELLASHNYEIPQALEATICMTSELLSSASRIFIDNRNVRNDRTFTRCGDTFGDGSLQVGGCCPDGLAIALRSRQGLRDVGVAGVRRFYED